MRSGRVTRRGGSAQAHWVQTRAATGEGAMARGAHARSRGVGCGVPAHARWPALRNRGGEVLEGSGSASVAAGRRERAEALGSAASVGTLSRLVSLASRYGGDSRSGAVSSGVAAGAGSVRGKPGGLEPVSRRGGGGYSRR